jgi:hypothetical protein
VIVLLKSTARASAEFYAAILTSRLFFPFCFINRVNVRGPCDPHLLSRGGGLGWVPGTAETNRPFVEYPTLILRGSAGPMQKHVSGAAGGIAECVR